MPPDSLYGLESSWCLATRVSSPVREILARTLLYLTIRLWAPDFGDLDYKIRLWKIRLWDYEFDYELEISMISS